MATVATNNSPVNDSKQAPTLEDVIVWVENQKKKGDMAESSSRLAAVALRAVGEQVAEDEPGHPKWVLDNLDMLLQRYLRRNPEAKSDTARSYGSRARTAITEYMRWDEAPTAYRPKGARGPAKPEKKQEPAKKTLPLALFPHATPTPEPAPAAAPAPPPAAPPIVAEHVRKVQPGDLRECPLGAERTFQYLPPPGGMKLKDALRVAFHLFTICDDYDPMVPPTQVFTSLQRTEQ